MGSVITSVIAIAAMRVIVIDIAVASCIVGGSGIANDVAIAIILRVLLLVHLLCVL